MLQPDGICDRLRVLLELTAYIAAYSALPRHNDLGNVSP